MVLINGYPFTLIYICEPIGDYSVNDAIFQGNFDDNGKKVFNAYINFPYLNCQFHKNLSKIQPMR